MDQQEYDLLYEYIRRKELAYCIVTTVEIIIH